MTPHIRSFAEIELASMLDCLGPDDDTEQKIISVLKISGWTLLEIETRLNEIKRRRVR